MFNKIMSTLNINISINTNSSDDVDLTLDEKVQLAKVDLDYYENLRDNIDTDDINSHINTLPLLLSFFMDNPVLLKVMGTQVVSIIELAAKMESIISEMIVEGVDIDFEAASEAVQISKQFINNFTEQSLPDESDESDSDESSQLHPQPEDC